MRYLIPVVFGLLPLAAHAEGEILLRQNNGRYEAMRPPPSSAQTPGYYTRNNESGGVYTGVYDRAGNRVGTIKSDAGGTRFYDNRGNRR